MRFGERATRYRNSAVVQREVAAWCAEWLERDVAGLSALELGAGSGLFTELLAERGFGSLIASDLSQRMVEEGRRHAPAAEWREADAWERQPARCDRLYACSVLQWADEPQRVLENWRDSLKPGGRVLAALFVKGSLREFAAGNGRFSALAFRSSEAWRQLFHDAGFDVLRHDTKQSVQQYDSAVAALRSLHDTGAVSPRKMGTAELRALLAERETEYLKDGCFPLTWEALRVEAQLV